MQARVLGEIGVGMCICHGVHVSVFMPVADSVGQGVRIDRQHPHAGSVGARGTGSVGDSVGEGPRVRRHRNCALRCLCTGFVQLLRRLCTAFAPSYALQTPALPSIIVCGCRASRCGVLSAVLCGCGCAELLARVPAAPAGGRGARRRHAALKLDAQARRGSEEGGGDFFRGGGGDFPTEHLNFSENCAPQGM